MNCGKVIYYKDRMGDLAADRPAWWHWAYLGLGQSSSQLQMISPTLARWRWACLGSAVLKPAKSLIKVVMLRCHCHCMALSDVLMTQATKYSEQNISLKPILNWVNISS